MQPIYVYLIVIVSIMIALGIVYFIIKQYKQNSKKSKQNTDSLFCDYKQSISQLPEQVLQNMKSQNYPILFLIGQAGTQKTQIVENLKKINKNTRVQMDENFEFVNFDNKFILVDTPPFNLDGDIDEREKTVKLFQNIFFTLSEQIIAFIIVVKFEGTDIMKQNIMKSYKFLSKFQEIIYIMISDFQLSEDQEKDKIQLEGKLKHFQNQDKSFKNLLYYENSSNNQSSIHQCFELLLQIVEQNKRIRLNFKDTIFDLHDEPGILFQQDSQKICLISKQ